MRLLAYQIFSSVVSITIVTFRTTTTMLHRKRAFAYVIIGEKTPASKNVNIHPGDNTLILVPELRTFAYTETFANRN